MRPARPVNGAAGSPGRQGSARQVLGSFIGIGGMVCVLFLVLASVLFAPAWAVVVLALVWVGLFWLATRWFMTRPWQVALLPVVMVAVWFGTALLGAYVLGWGS
jgi:hypothetical protein